MRGSFIYFVIVGYFVFIFLGAGCADNDKTSGTTEQQEEEEAVIIPDSLKGINITQFHASISADTDSNLCVSCHGEMTDKTTLDTRYKEFHNLKHSLLARKCTDCHNQPVDLLEYSGANLMKQIDVQKICYECHGPNKIATQLYE